ncbi:MAG: NAD-glutamate dehydrogenase [Alphaproteobacteria bacterium]|nr:NAD-glutamate dehydrogenase [Alphaproteobacteria bacterium]
MPFLVDSIVGELNEQGHRIHLILHPILSLSPTTKTLMDTRETDMEKKNITPGPRKSFILIHVEYIQEKDGRKRLADGLDKILNAIRVTVEDWPHMLQCTREITQKLHTAPPSIAPDEIEEAVHFLKWIAEDNFTFIGMREYSFNKDGKSENEEPQTQIQTGLGMLRDHDLKLLRYGKKMLSFTPELQEFLQKPVPLIITKASIRSLVHRRAHLDYIGIKIFSETGQVQGELRIIGLFTSTAYTKSVNRIPYLRRKVQNVLQQTGFDTKSHSGKTLLNVLENYPRDELFQIDQDLLTSFVLTIIQLEKDARPRVLPRVDKFNRFVSLLVFVPRDRFSTNIRKKIGDYLAHAYNGRVSVFYPAFLESFLVRVHYIIGHDDGDIPSISRQHLEADIVELIRDWRDRLHIEIARKVEPQQIEHLQNEYGNAFPTAYQERYDTATALRDVTIIEKLKPGNPITLSFTQNEKKGKDQINVRFYNTGTTMTLSERVPILENMGFNVIKERTYSLHPKKSEKIYLHDMSLLHNEPHSEKMSHLTPLLEDCFRAVWSENAEDDGYNKLVLLAGLNWKEISVLRAYSRYLRQILVPYSQDYMWTTLNTHPAIAADLAAMFHARFSTENKTDKETKETNVTKIMKRIEEALQKVKSLDEDRIIRHFIKLIMATIRCNSYQYNTRERPWAALAFKIAPGKLDNIPQPKPYREIWVYSPQFEGVHMRFGKVARGGLRWSDRCQDFRTEILGLVKAQRVKNAVIVPLGAKGGFVCKIPATGKRREDIQANGIRAYKSFISALLDITDNIVNTEIIAPTHLIRHDENDPYLVVAADKGTATFSDIANELSQERGFWLDDAFASGGSTGYDHKKMGITARGAWEAVKRHFRETGVNIQTTEFNVIGVGDMSGDVFGNGMLLSKEIRLIAAFDHRHIFIDPNPDKQTSFAERKRLFGLKCSSWDDYDKKSISEGGAVIPRTEKSITLSPEMKGITGLKQKKATPDEIINALLKAKVDLLWFGGIGTYVRAEKEKNEDTGDRANDPVRVSALELQAKVVGEGANLAFTQAARVEFALQGGRINSDAIDNSAGVNCSDLEVNIKIALREQLQKGKISIEARNVLLTDMTEDIANAVLKNTYLQTLSLSLSQKRGIKNLPFQKHLLYDLEKRGLLDRKLESLPNDSELIEREKKNKPLTRPELAILLAYAKISLSEKLGRSSVLQDNYLQGELKRYFPSPLQEHYPEAIATHKLRQEIITASLSNAMINQGGADFMPQVAERTCADVEQVAKAFIVVQDSFCLNEINTNIDKLDNHISSTLQINLYTQIQDMLLNQIPWFIKQIPPGTEISDTVARYKSGIECLFISRKTILPEKAAKYMNATALSLEENGVPARTATHIAALDMLARAPDIVLTAEETGKSIMEVASLFFAVGEILKIDEINKEARNLPLTDYFEHLALNDILEIFSQRQREITKQVLLEGTTAPAALKNWEKTRKKNIASVQKIFSEIEYDSALTLSRLIVFSEALHNLTRP